MDKNKKTPSLLVGAAVAGLFLGMTSLPACSGGSQAGTSQEKNGCNGQNGCKSKAAGHDAKDKNSCSGPNGCKGADAKKG
jgi:hypothetical protein